MSASTAPAQPARPPRSRRQRLRGRVPGALVACVLVGMASAFAWSLITPPFQGPDEQAHVAYAQFLAEAGKPPPGGTARPPWSAEEQNALTALLFDRLVFDRAARPVWTREQDRALRAQLGAKAARGNGGGASNATNNPPLYYALEVAPYELASSGTLLDRLFLMRLLSVLLTGCTVAFSFLFLRELLPRPPWAPVVGALAVALQPTLGFVGGIVNNDALLVAAAAACFWLLARSFRRGLTMGCAVAIGAAAAAGVLAKLTMLGLLPGIAAGLLLLGWRERASGARVVLGRLAAAAVVLLVPLVAVWLASRTWWDRNQVGSATGVASAATAQHHTLRELLSYAWQFYLPALPGMHRWLAGYPLWEAWVKGFVGRFGWQDTEFPRWAYDVALAVAIALLAGAGVALARARATLRRRLPELATYALMLLGLLAVIAVAGFGYLATNGQRFEQGRYLLSLIPLYGAIVALAARAAGRRAGPAVAIALVTVLALHDVLAQLLVIGRYYL